MASANSALARPRRGLERLWTAVAMSIGIHRDPSGRRRFPFRLPDAAAADAETKAEKQPDPEPPFTTWRSRWSVPRVHLGSETVPEPIGGTMLPDLATGRDGIRQSGYALDSIRPKG